MPFDGTLRPRASTEEVSRAYENLVRLEQFFDGAGSGTQAICATATGAFA